MIKGAAADWICTPAPIHNPDGTESLWCYTKPQELYGELRDALGHFPLMNFWGPLADIRSTRWIVDSAIRTAGNFRPRFLYVYLPHLDNVFQKFGPDSPQATAALGELDAEIGKLRDGLAAAGMTDVLWVAASEYVITPVTGVGYPNRRLREAGLLSLDDQDGAEMLNVRTSRLGPSSTINLRMSTFANRPTSNRSRTYFAPIRRSKKFSRVRPVPGAISIIRGPATWC